MTDRPIIFSAPMVRALLDGRKTQTRRLATSPLRKCEAGDRLWVRESCAAEELCRPPRERPATAAERQRFGRTRMVDLDEQDGQDGVRYAADKAFAPIPNSREAGDQWSELFHYGGGRPEGAVGRLVPSIHMPRWASRITLIIKSVRIEPLQSISKADAIAEGIESLGSCQGSEIWRNYESRSGWWEPRESYRSLWASLHGAESWAANPEVVVIDFSVVAENIDRIAS